MTSIRAALEQASRALAALPQASPRVEAELLLAAASERSRAHLYTWPEAELAPAAEAAFRRLLARRLAGEPVAYILGRQAFWTLELAVGPGVLIPRPETELLVERALAACPPEPPLAVADLGAGSGAIAAAIAAERPGWTVFAVDASAPALAVADANFRRLGLGNVACCLGDWCDALPAGQRLDLVLSNPPYVADGDPHLDAGDLRHEPRAALAAGPDGLDAIRALLPQAWERLRPGGLLLLEHGWEQGEAVRRLLARAGFAGVATLRDGAGLERVGEGWRPG